VFSFTISMEYSIHFNTSVKCNYFSNSHLFLSCQKKGKPYLQTNFTHTTSLICSLSPSPFFFKRENKKSKSQPNNRLQNKKRTFSKRFREEKKKKQIERTGLVFQKKVSVRKSRNGVLFISSYG
jgi:hypothetical protein